MKVMKKTYAVLVIILVLTASFGLTGCDNGLGGGGEAALNGTWDGIGAAAGNTVIIHNGNIEGHYRGLPIYRGTFTISGNTMTTTVTHIHGSQFAELGFPPTWFLRAQLRVMFMGLGVPLAETEALLDGLFVTDSAPFSLSGNTLSSGGYTFVRR